MGMQYVVDIFIPHEGNNYQPHLSDKKRMRRYGVAFFVVKLIVVVAIFAMPSSLFMSDQAFAALEAALINQTNAQRVMHGRAALYPDKHLEQSATARAVDLGTFGYFNHVGPQGQVFEDFLRQSAYPYTAAGENLAMGFVDAKTVIDAWMASPTHRANLLAMDYTDIGIGAARGTFAGRPVVYIAQHIGRQSGDATASASMNTHFVRQEESYADWSPVPSGTMISVVVRSQLPVSELTAQVYSAVIPLTKREKNVFVGSAVLTKKPDELFRVQLLPTVTATIGSFESTETIGWKRIYIPNQTIQNRFQAGKVVLNSVAPNFLSFTRVLFGIALIVFVMILILSIIAETHKRHPHIVGQTALLVAFLAILIVL